MGLINLYNSLDKTSEKINANGKIKDVLPEIDFTHAMILKEGHRLTEDYEIQPEDVLFVRLIPGEGVSTVLTVVSIVVSVIAAGVSIGISAYQSNLANQQAQNALKATEDAIREAEKAKTTLQEAAQTSQEQTNTNSGITVQNKQLPFLRGASNASALGKTIQFLMGEMYNTPYTLTSGFYTLEGTHGQKQYWNAILTAGFANQLIKSLSVGNTKVKTFTDTTPQEGDYSFDNGIYYSENNLIEIAQTRDFQHDIFKKKSLSDYYQELIPDLGNDYWNDDWKRYNPEEWQKLEDKVIIKQAPDNAKELEVCFNFQSGFYCWGNGQYYRSKADLLCWWSNDDGQTWHQMALDRHDVEKANPDVPDDQCGYYYIKEDGSKEYVDSPYGAESGKWVVDPETGIKHWVYSYSWEDRGGFGKYESLVDAYYNETARFSFKKVFTKAESYGKTILVKVNIHWYYGAGSYSPVYLQYIQAKCFDVNKSNSSSNLVDCNSVEAPFNINTTRIGLKIEANDKTKDLLDQINIIASGVARVWNGRSWTSNKVPTRNPASWILEILESPTHNLSRFTDDEIDLNSFGALYDYCEQQGFYTDSIITESIKKFDLISEILATVNADLIYNADGKIEVVIDKKETTPVALITSQNIRSIVYAKSLERKIDGLKISYVNRDNWAVDTINVMRDGGSKDVNDVVVASELKHVTTHDHAYKVAQRKQRQIILQPREISVDVGNEGDYYPLYSTVLLQLEHLYIGLKSSVIHDLKKDSSDNVTGIIIGDSVTFEAGKRYGVILQAQNDSGRKLIYREVTGNGTTHTLTFSTSIPYNESILPEYGNEISFGYLDENGGFKKVTNVMKITGVTPTDNGMTLILKDYNEAMYEYGTIPLYKSNLTRPSNVLPQITPSNLADKLEPIYKRFNQIEYGENTEKPAAPTDVKGLAGRDTIKFSCALTQTNITDTVTKIYYEINKGSGWQSVDGDTYNFIRSVDGYPEKSTLSTWKVRCYLKNIYNMNSSYSDEKTVDVSYYGTWHIEPITTDYITKEIIDRTAIFRFSTPKSSGLENYGETKFRVSIKRIGIEYGSESTSGYPTVIADTDYYKPDLFSSPYTSETNYKTSDVNGYVESGSTYSQVLPLAGQNANNAVNTRYKFRVCATNESGYVTNWTEFEVTALCTSIRDIVKANADYKNLYVEKLSAIVANVGLINQGGFGDFAKSNNYWALSKLFPIDTGLERTIQEGEFRVGDSNSYIQVSYDQNGAAVVSFKTTSFTVTAVNTEFSKEIVIQENASSLDRTRITAKGTYYEHRKTTSDDWYTINKMDTSGVESPVFHSDKQIKIGNSDQVQDRSEGRDIGRLRLSDNGKVWHFDDNEYSNNGTYDGLTIEGSPSERSLKGADDSNGIDYTPAILAEAPYCINSKSLYGKYALKYTISSTKSFTVDFWMQYRYNESQQLFDIGTGKDKLLLKIKPAEPVAVVSGVCRWTKDDVTVYTHSRNPEVHNYIYSTEYDAINNFGNGVLIENRTLSESGAVESINGYEFAAGDPDMNWETFAPASMWESSSVIANRANYADTELIHYNNEKQEIISFNIDLQKKFDEGTWYHIGVVFTDNNCLFFMDSMQKSFNRFKTVSDDVTIQINDTLSTILVDELYIDKAAETYNDFKENTVKRIPWGSITDSDDWFIFDAKDTSKVKSNILDKLKNDILDNYSIKIESKTLQDEYGISYTFDRYKDKIIITCSGTYTRNTGETQAAIIGSLPYTIAKTHRVSFTTIQSRSINVIIDTDGFISVAFPYKRQVISGDFTQTPSGSWTTDTLDYEQGILKDDKIFDERVIYL